MGQLNMAVRLKTYITKTTKQMLDKNEAQVLFMLTLHMDWTTGIHVLHMRTAIPIFFSFYDDTAIFGNDSVPFHS